MGPVEEARSSQSIRFELGPITSIFAVYLGSVGLIIKMAPVSGTGANHQQDFSLLLCFSPVPTKRALMVSRNAGVFKWS
jgi:hypothetical protein